MYYSIAVPIPPLKQLYEAGNDFIEMNKIKWKIFAWITSFTDDEISMIKQLPRDFLLISTTLYILVKVIFNSEHAIFSFSYQSIHLNQFVQRMD